MVTQVGSGTSQSHELRCNPDNHGYNSIHAHIGGRSVRFHKEEANQEHGASFHFYDTASRFLLMLP
jgi:hypothetical protein